MSQLRKLKHENTILKAEKEETQRYITQLLIHSEINGMNKVVISTLMERAGLEQFDIPIHEIQHHRGTIKEEIFTRGDGESVLSITIKPEPKAQEDAHVSNKTD